MIRDKTAAKSEEEKNCYWC